jgi:hypothetical protein
MNHKFLSFMLILFLVFTSSSLAQQHYTCTLSNDSLSLPNVYEFDITMLSNDTSSIELAGINFGFTFNHLVLDNGSLSVAWVPQSSELTNQSELPKNFIATTNRKDSSLVGIIKIGPRIPPGFGNGSIISNKGRGTRIGRLRLTNSVNFADAQMNINWNFLKTGGLYPTTITVYIDKKNTNVTSAGVFDSKLRNPILK